METIYSTFKDILVEFGNEYQLVRGYANQERTDKCVSKYVSKLMTAVAGRDDKPDLSGEPLTEFEMADYILMICCANGESVSEKDARRESERLYRIAAAKVDADLSREYNAGYRHGFSNGKVNRWKPDENQMIALRAVVQRPANAGAETCRLCLDSLLTDLEKLQEDK